MPFQVWERGAGAMGTSLWANQGSFDQTTRKSKAEVGELTAIVHAPMSAMDVYEGHQYDQDQAKVSEPAGPTPFAEVNCMSLTVPGSVAPAQRDTLVDHKRLHL